jgi:hypothetical protein
VTLPLFCFYSEAVIDDAEALNNNKKIDVYVRVNPLIAALYILLSHVGGRYAQSHRGNTAAYNR